MKFSKKGVAVIFSLIILLNLIIRIPSLPHSYGFDSFGIRALANSVALFGEARYWIHPLSIGGFYPYSYASAVPFLLAGIKNLTNLDPEMYPLLYCISIGLLSFFTAFILAREILKSDFYAYIVGFVFSTSQGVLVFSTWDVTTRGLFVVLLPVLMYLLLKSSRSPLKFSFMILFLLSLLTVTHHYIYFTIPIILSFIFLKIAYFLDKRNSVSFPSKLKNPLSLNILYILGLFIFLAIPFFTRFFIVGSKYAWIFQLIKVNVRYSGILMFLALGGLIHLTLKENKAFAEWLIMLSLLGLVPVVYNLTYTHFILVVFSAVMIGMSFNNLAASYLTKRKRKKIFMNAIVFFIITSIIFSSFYQHYRTGTGGGRKEWYMKESTYQAGIWVKDYIPPDKVLVGNVGVYNPKPGRIFAVSGGLPRSLSGEAVGLSYGFINKTEIKVRMNDPLSISFYQENPYVKVEPRWSVAGLLSWLMFENDIDKSGITKKFGASYMVEYTRWEDKIILSVRGKKDCLFSNGETKIWIL
jgi:hypothetical protein